MISRKIGLFLSLIAFICIASQPPFVSRAAFGVAPGTSRGAVRAGEVILGGQAIGLLVHAQGVRVVAVVPVVTAEGQRKAPAAMAGVKVGDAILAVDGTKVLDAQVVADAVDRAGRAGRTLTLTLERQGRTWSCTVEPLYDRFTGRYRLGVYLRAGESGVGTLTFVEPRTRRFAALGHAVAARAIRTSGGTITAATVVGIRAGQRGEPGQKIGVIDGDETWGIVDRDTDVGVMGRFEAPIARRALPVADVSDVHVGDALLYTVVQGRTPKAYHVRIERVLTRTTPTPKAFILRVTDAGLLRRAGGIVQGMSGSPIVQDGRLVGAVTHVFVRDPTRGFGALAYWMWQRCRMGA